MLIILAIPKPKMVTLSEEPYWRIFSKNKIKSESSDLFITLLDSDLSPVLANHYGGPKDQMMSSFNDSGSELIFVGGLFSESVQFSTNAIMAVGGNDAFVTFIDKKI